MKNKYIIGQYIIDYIPIRLLNKITIKDVYEWREFLFIFINIFGYNHFQRNQYIPSGIFLLK